MQWHNNQSTALLQPVIIRINPPYRHFQQSARLSGAATKLEHNLPEGRGVDKTRSITQRFHARSGYFVMKGRWTSPGNSNTAEGLVIVAVEPLVMLFGCTDITACMSHRGGDGLVSWPYSMEAQQKCYDWISHFDLRRIHVFKMK